MGTFDTLSKAGLITPPEFVTDIKKDVHYETIMGSLAYGVSSDNSDIDVYGFLIPPKEIVFPHSAGYISGFGTQPKKFDQLQVHHIKHGQSEYDITIYNIVKFFNLCFGNNPNMIDSLFTPERCVQTQTKIGRMVRDSRKLFLSKQVFQKFKGYAYSQLHKLSIRTPVETSKRREKFDMFGYDVKYAYHLVRLLNEAQQILVEHDLDLEKNREQLKSVRRGEWSLDQIKQYFESKAADLEELYSTSTLRAVPDEKVIKELLLNCLEEHWGNLDIGNSDVFEMKLAFERINRIT